MKACNNRKLLHGQLFSGLLLKQQIIVNLYKKNNQPTNQPTNQLSLETPYFSFIKLNMHLLVIS